MCLIIANIDGRPIPEEFIKSAFRGNDDGFGVMWATEKGVLHIVRNVYKSHEPIVSIIGSLTKRNLPYVAHFRMATHGPVVKDNCHPFRVSDFHGGIGMVHNGCFGGHEFYNSPGKSDTAVMADKIAENLKNGHFSTRDLFTSEAPEFTKRYHSSFGWSRIAFMNGDGDINILNESDGSWINGVWYSNEYAVGTHNIKNNNYRVISGISVINNRKALELVLAGDHPDDNIVELDDDDLIEDKDIDDMFGRAFCEAGTELDMDDDESEEEDDEILHPFAKSDGYSSSDISKQSAKSFMFEGVEYDLTEEATFLSEEDIQEAIDGAENGSMFAASIVEDLVHRAQRKKAVDEVLDETFEDGPDEDFSGEDESAWRQFVSDYNKTKNRGSLALPASTEEKGTVFTSASAASSETTKTFATSTNGAYRYSQYGSPYSYYSNKEYVTGYYAKPNDPIDQIVEALLLP